MKAIDFGFYFLLISGWKITNSLMKSIYQRIKNKKIRDFVVYGKRRSYLRKVESKYNRHGGDYFFSNNYLKKHLNFNSSECIGNQFRTHTAGLIGDLSAAKSKLSALFSESPIIFDQIIKSADRIVDHEFDLLGSGVVQLNFPSKASGIFGVKIDMEANSEPNISKWLHDGYQPIDWHFDFKSGYRWSPNAYYPESRNYSDSQGADIKVPWELSRCQHLPLLGLAFMANGNSRYCEEIISQLIDWIDNNPLCKGPNWNCPMDVAIRAANWLVALEMIRGFHDEKSNPIYQRILASIVQHTDYLWNNFEWTSKLTSNHYLSDISGFLFCLVYTPGLKKKNKFLAFVKNEFEGEIKKQMYSDGMNSEGSVPYHRLVLELFSYSTLLAKRNGLDFSSEYYNALAQSFKFTAAVLKNDGTVPQIGDNDGGIFFKFFNRSLTVHDYLLTLGECIFNSHYRVSKDTGALESALFSNNIKPDSAKKPTKLTINHFRKSGLVILKSEELFFTFYNGKNGQKGNGGHCHNDRNSITLQWKEADILEDAGTGVYTPFPEIRNKFRSTESHNTVSIVGNEQNRFYENGYLFGSYEDITETFTEVQQLDNQITINGKHNGFSKIEPGAEHQREVILNNNDTLTIKDRLGTSAHMKQAYFLIKKSEDLIFKDDKVIADHFDFSFEGYHSITVDSWDFSPSYGELIPDYFMRVCVLFCTELITTVKLK